MKTSALSPFGLLIETDVSVSLKYLSSKILEENLLSHKLVLTRGLRPLEKVQFLEFILSLTPPKPKIEDRLLHWDFGPVMELQFRENSENYLFSNEKVPFHWDGAFHREPSFLAFNAIESPRPDSGGETLFTNVEAIYEDLSDHERQLLKSVRLQYQTEKRAHYGGEITVSAIQRHPVTGRNILRYAEPVETKLNPVGLKISGLEGMSELEFQNWMHQMIYDSKYCYEHQWKDGDILIVDNFSALHARRAFTKNVPRHIRRIQIL